jgi:DNA-binding SARP family transcriptional activator/predicted RNA-binding Zn ribbon-like protein
MEFHLLGPFQAHHDGRPIEVRLRRQERGLLAALLLDAGHVVPVDRLIDLLWDGKPPASARGVIHTYIGRLRTALRPYGVEVATHSDGYTIDTDKHELDLARFEHTTSRVYRAADPAERLELCAEALGLWRGTLLADLADDGLRQRLGHHIEELRLSMHEVRAEALLDLGRHEQVVTEALPLVGLHPTRTRLVASLMTGLHRCGRQADALLAYQSHRESLGIEPGQDLELLADQIRRDDPRLDRPVVPVFQVRFRDQWLPWTVGGHPALDFCNTYAGWGGPRRPGAEWLRGYATLATWVGYVDLVDDRTVTRLLGQARESPLDAASIMDEARRLRAQLYACLTGPDDIRAFDGVAAHARAASRVADFVRVDGGLGRWRVSGQAGLRLPVHAVALSAADLLADPRRHTVCVCANEDCGWLFLDDSGRRRWCNLSTCRANAGRRELCGQPPRLRPRPAPHR